MSLKKTCLVMSGVLLLAACDSSSKAGTAVLENSAPANDDLAATMRQIDPARIIHTIEQSPQRFPVEWGMVTKTEHGSMAESIGIVPGDRIVERAGIPFNRFYTKSGDGDVMWLDAQGELKKHHVKAGIMGVGNIIERDFVSWFVLHGNRNPKWDAEVVAALAVHERNPGMAARLWKVAHEKGYPNDRLSHLCGMLIACSQGDPDSAAAHAKAFGPLAGAPSGLPCWDSDWQQVSASTGDPKWMVNAGEYLLEKYPDNDSVREHNDIADIQMIASREAGSPPAGSPSELAGRMNRKSITHQLTHESPWADEDGSLKRDLDAMFSEATKTGQSGQKDFPPQSFRQMLDTSGETWFGPQTKTRDMDMTVELTVAPLDVSSPARYLREFIIGFANRTMHGGRREIHVPPSARICAVSYSFGNYPELGRSTINALVPSRIRRTKMSLRNNPYQIGGRAIHPNVPDHRPKPGMRHSLRFVRVGNQVESLLDGKRLALVQVPSHLDDTGVFFFISGVEVTVTSFQADALN